MASEAVRPEAAQRLAGARGRTVRQRERAAGPGRQHVDGVAELRGEAVVPARHRRGLEAYESYSRAWALLKIIRAPPCIFHSLDHSVAILY